MLIFGSLPSLVLLGIILFGAYKAWMGVTHLLSKTFFHQTEEAHVKKISFIVIAISVLTMLAPFLIPATGYFRDVLFVLYAIYGGTTLWQGYSWYSAHFGKKDNAAPKNDKSGK